jgi:phosphatidylglycerophosphatase A
LRCHFHPVFIIGGFALFRVFDILKPFPIRWVDKKVPGGLGIMLDDMLAGIFANGMLRARIISLIINDGFFSIKQERPAPF